MTLHARLTEEIRRGPSGPKVGAFFDLDQTLLAGFSAAAFFRERLASGRVSPREMSDSLLGALCFALGRTGYSGMMAATTAASRIIQASLSALAPTWVTAVLKPASSALSIQSCSFTRSSVMAR